jgi:hypothetical protein
MDADEATRVEPLLELGQRVVDDVLAAGVRGKVSLSRATTWVMRLGATRAVRRCWTRDLRHRAPCAGSAGPLRVLRRARQAARTEPEIAPLPENDETHQPSLGARRIGDQIEAVAVAILAWRLDVPHVDGGQCLVGVRAANCSNPDPRRVPYDSNSFPPASPSTENVGWRRIRLDASRPSNNDAINVYGVICTSMDDAKRQFESHPVCLRLFARTVSIGSRP